VASASRGAVDRLPGGEMQTATSKNGGARRKNSHTFDDDDDDDDAWKPERGWRFGV